MTGFALPAIFYVLLPIEPFIYAWYVWFSIGIIKLIYELADWYFDAWLITNVSVIDVEWNGFFNRSSTRIEYSGIRGITYNIKGFWGTILGFGDIIIEHFLYTESFRLNKASNPKKIERAILNEQEIFTNAKTMQDHEALKNMIVELALRERIKASK